MPNILLVEDEPRIISFMIKGLTQAGYNTQTAMDGEQALSMLQGEEFDLLLLDLGLPIVDGRSVLKELQAQNIQIPVIVITAIAVLDAQTEIFDLGAQELITKPFRFSDLLACIRRYV